MLDHVYSYKRLQELHSYKDVSTHVYSYKDHVFRSVTKYRYRWTSLTFLILQFTVCHWLLVYRCADLLMSGCSLPAFCGQITEVTVI